MTKSIAKIKLIDKETKEIKYETEITKEIYNEMLKYDRIWHEVCKGYIDKSNTKAQQLLKSIENRLTFLNKKEENKEVVIDIKFLKALCLIFKNKNIKKLLISIIVSNDMTKNEIIYSLKTKENEM